MNLAFTLTEEADNSKVYITDTTADWGAGEILAVFNSGSATLTPIIKGVTYDAITVTAYFSSGLQSSLVFPISAVQLKIGGVDQFSAGDDVPDGDWYVTYYADTGATTDWVTDGYLVYGVSELGVLNEIRLTDLNDWSFDNTLYEAQIKCAHYVYLEGIKASAYEGEVNNLREALANLETMLENGTY